MLGFICLRAHRHESIVSTHTRICESQCFYGRHPMYSREAIIYKQLHMYIVEDTDTHKHLQKNRTWTHVLICV